MVKLIFIKKRFDPGNVIVVKSAKIMTCKSKMSRE
jgi:hypothetical protein